MAVLKCKMCGGNLEITENPRIGICEYCGTKQTLPRFGDDNRLKRFERANHLRRNNEFDKAMSLYEIVLNEDTTDAEAYWSLILCKYGIEYVEDAATHKRIITCNRTQYTSVFADEDYKSALEYADSEAKKLYIAEATEIDHIQKGILDISSKEEPFDVFICYKETDSSGRRTQDSVLAQELYFQLRNEGFKAFFSRITLEEKLGTEYEPYIFAALNSAKVMVVVATRPEYVASPWVKNEWGRYLAIIKKNPQKMLIPAYRDMNPYDLPEDFSHLQAQDMSKLGFMQDLIHGIKKIVKPDNSKPPVPVIIQPSGNVDALLKRVYMALEDGEFDSADTLCEQVLNQDPENAKAYLGKLMVEMRVRQQYELERCTEPFVLSKNYQKVIRFGEDELANTLKQYNVAIRERNRRKEEFEKKDKDYLAAVEDSESHDISRLEKAIETFTALNGYKDSTAKARLCGEKIDKIRTEEEQKLAKKELRKQERAKRKEKSAKIVKKTLPVAIVCIVVVAFIFLGNFFVYYIRYCKTIEGISYSYNDDGLIVSDSDKMPYLSVTDGVVRKKAGFTVPDELVIPGIFDGERITAIGRYAFHECESVESVNISSGISIIGESAFGSCGKIESVKIPSSTEIIAQRAFSVCYSLKEVEFSEGLKIIGDGAFYNCNLLKEVKFSEGLKIIGDAAFGFCDLKEVKFSEGLKNIGEEAFVNNEFVEVVYIPASLQEISRMVFYWCDYLTTIRYNGTKSQWEEIKKYDGWDVIANDSETGEDISGNFTIICTDGTISNKD